MEYLDKEGYPTEQLLNKIEFWPCSDFIGLFETIRDVWAYRSSTFYSENAISCGKCVARLYISTGEWSVNESLINALKHNFVIWNMYWYSHTRGGHYVFQFSKTEDIMAIMEKFNRFRKS